MRLIPKNWGDFQHYKDRAPKWIKLHKELLDNFDFQRLQVASRALAPMLWLLASEYEDGAITASGEEIAFRLRMSEADFDAALKPLIAKGFFTLEQDASNLLAQPERDASPEKRRGEIEKEEEEEGELLSANADAPKLPATIVPLPVKAQPTAELVEAVQAYNAVAAELGWPQAAKLTETRRVRLVQRLKDADGLEGWLAAMARARSSAYLRGETKRSKGFENWTPDLEFFLQQSTFIKLLEGKYDDRTNHNQAAGFDGIIAAARAVASQ